MIHYTCMPLELIFTDPNQPKSTIREVTVDGVTMIVQLNEHQEATIVQLLSLNPMDYIDPRFQPGNKLQLFPKF